MDTKVRISPKSKLSLFAFSLIILACLGMGKLLIPFVVSLILAYALHIPLEKISSRFKVSRSASAGIISLLIISSIAMLVLFLIPPLSGALSILMQNLPYWLQSLPNILNKALHDLALAIGVETTFDLGSFFNEYLYELTRNFPDYIVSFIGTGVNLIYMLMYAIMIPIITFYLLKDWDKIEISFEKLLRKIAPDPLAKTLKVINLRLGEYVKGQLRVCLILAALYTICLMALGVHRFLVCGIFSGILSFAPFVGPFIGLTSTLAMSLQSLDFSYNYVRYILVVIPYLIIPFLDSNFITPRFIGKSTGVHPVWLLFSICLMVSILGTVGIFISVPMAVILSTVCKEVAKKI